MHIEPSVKVQYELVTSPLQAGFILSKLPSLVACDFEARSKYSAEYKEQLKLALTSSVLDQDETLKIRQLLNATALHHASHVWITHLSVAISDAFAYVFVLDTPAMTRTILQWIVNTNCHQIWHNAGYDLTLVYYHTQKFPKFFDDTRLMAKAMLNNCLDYKSNVKLKYLKGYKYGRWAVSPDVFETVDIYNPDFLEYAATDACATYDLYQDIIAYSKEDE